MYQDYEYRGNITGRVKLGKRGLAKGQKMQRCHSIADGMHEGFMTQAATSRKKEARAERQREQRRRKRA